MRADTPVVQIETPKKNPIIIWYTHHKRKVWVRDDLKGHHRNFCLCYICKRNPFNREEGEEKCPIADAIYQNCKEFGVVTPVWECPEFEDERD